MYKSKIYRIWDHMIQRCNNPKTDSYDRYGGRGITVCKEWVEDFECFYAWAVSTGYVEPLSIERIDVNGNYEPSNCKWIPLKDQYLNRRNSIGFAKAESIRSNFPSMSVSDLSKEFGIHRTTVKKIVMNQIWK